MDVKKTIKGKICADPNEVQCFIVTMEVDPVFNVSDRPMSSSEIWSLGFFSVITFYVVGVIVGRVLMFLKSESQRI